MDENEGITRDKFSLGLNYEIVDLVAMYYYDDLEDIVYQGIKIEQQMKH